MATLLLVPLLRHIEIDSGVTLTPIHVLLNPNPPSMHRFDNINSHISQPAHIDEQITNHTDRMLNCLVDFNTGVSLILCVLDVDIVIAICFTEIGFFEHVQH